MDINKNCRIFKKQYLKKTVFKEILFRLSLREFRKMQFFLYFLTFFLKNINT